MMCPGVAEFMYVVRDSDGVNFIFMMYQRISSALGGSVIEGSTMKGNAKSWP